MSGTPTLTVYTGDPPGLARFYLALGFTELIRSEAKVQLELDGLRLSIVSGAQTGHTRPSNHLRGFELTVQLEDLASVQPALVAAGGTVPTDQPAERTGILVLDPDGNPVRLGQPTDSAIGRDAPRSAGEPHTGQQSKEPPPTISTPDGLTPAGPSLPATYYTEDGVPTFDAVAERIHRDSASAEGSAVLDAESARGQAERDGFDKLKTAGKDRLDQLRKSMGL